MKKIILHIGLTKTGTTSFQFLCGENRGLLRRYRADYFLGSRGLGYGHSELFLSCLRSRVDTFADEEWNKDRQHIFEQTKRRVKVFVENSGVHSHVFCAGGLCFLRTDEELIKLKSLFPRDSQFRIIFVERDKDEWLASWAKQIVSKPGRELSRNPNSTMYVEPDTWLTDFEQLKDVWKSNFDDFTCIPYRKEGLIEDICDEIGIKLPPSALRTRYKERGQARQAPSLVERARQKVRRLANRADYWMRYGRHL